MALAVSGVVSLRRRVAVLIRIRQEVQKRIDRATRRPHYAGHRSLIAHLDSAIRSSTVAVQDADALAAHFRTSAARRLFAPISDSSSLPDRQAILLQAESVLQGKWNTLGKSFELSSATPDWRRHPESGKQTSLAHFSVIPYTGDHLGGDVKYLWELNRHKELLRLAQAHHLTNDERYANAVVQHLLSWFDENPIDCGVNWASALEVAFRSITWCWIWRLTAKSNAWSTDAVLRLVWTLSHAGRFLWHYDSIHHSPNTHLTGEALGLLYIGSTFPELRHAPRWRDRGRGILSSELPYQFLHDGFHFERCTGYHRYNLEFYLHALALARASREQWADGIVPHVKKALLATRLLQKPDGDWPVFGDEDGGSMLHLWSSSPRNQAPLLVFGSALVPDEANVMRAQPEDASLCWWFGHHPLAPVYEGSRDVQAFALPDAGYVGARDHDAAYCVVDVGKHGGDRTGHAHTDVGHVEISFGKDNVVIDPGCAIYASDQVRRNWYRSLQAHATLSVDNEPLAIPRGPFGWSTTAPAPKWEVADKDAFWACRLYYAIEERGVQHERQVLLIRNSGVVVVDFVLGSGQHDLVWRWPLAVAVDSPVGGDIDSVADFPELPCRLSWSASTPFGTQVVDSVRSPTFGVEERASVVEIAAPATTIPCGLVTSFMRRGVALPEIRIATLEMQLVSAGNQSYYCRAGALPQRLEDARRVSNAVGAGFS